MLEGEGGDGVWRLDTLRFDDSVTPHNHTRSLGAAFDNTWRHVAWVDQNGSAQLYINGVLDGRDFSYTRGVLTANILSIGAILRTEATAWFQGAIDEVALWERALSAGEIQAVTAWARWVSRSRRDETKATPAPASVATFVGNFVLNFAGFGGFQRRWRNRFAGLARAKCLSEYPRTSGSR